MIYLLTIAITRNINYKKRSKSLLVFTTIYLLSTFVIVPRIAPIFGRQNIEDSALIKGHSFFYKLTNRTYVTPQLHNVLVQAARELNQKYNNIQLVYLDANFPFIDKFPLLPHLSHNDGKKIDLSFVYKENNQISNKKPSLSGYGVFESPSEHEYKQYEICKTKGYWQYDFPKHLTFGTLNPQLNFSEEASKHLISVILKQHEIGKIFIEPHLKARLNLSHSKLRFHGCQAVRHDDHIHIQLR